MAAKTALITGASRGIGKETARTLAKQNHNVIVVARSEAPLRELANEHPEHITACPTDLTNSDEREHLIELVKSQFSDLDILINNAGGLINKSFQDLTDDDWQTMLDANLMTAVKITRSLLPHLADGAHIVNISSMGGFQGSAKFPGLTAYSVAKGGLSILAECLAAELSDRNIRSNALCLGMVQTDMLEEAFPGAQAPVSAEQMGHYLARFALEGHQFYNGKVLPVALQDPD